MTVENGDNIPTARVRIVSDQIERAVRNNMEVFDARIKGIEHGIELFQADLVRVPTAVDRAIGGLRELVEAKIEKNSAVSIERFLRIDAAFTERDKRAEQLALASSTAIAAALQAQKEAAGEVQKSSAAAIAKSENATSESIKQLQTLFQTSQAGLSTQILDVKSRLDKGEGGSASGRTAFEDRRDEKSSSSTRTFAIVAVVVSMFVGVVELWS
jgi:hypothetical protein